LRLLREVPASQSLLLGGCVDSLLGTPHKDFHSKFTRWITRRWRVS
jgi:hypothetical protein